MDKRDFLFKRKRKLEYARNRLKKDFVGIDDIIDKVIDSIKVWYCVPDAITRPVVINLWGMTGVGKTDLVRKLVRYLRMSDKYVEVIMSSEGSEKTWDNSVQSILFDSDINQGEPGIIMFDEIQKYRTKDEHGKEIEKKHFNDMWVLLSDGKFSSHGKRGQIENFLQRICMHQYNEDKRMREEKEGGNVGNVIELSEEESAIVGERILSDEDIGDILDDVAEEIRKKKRREKKEPKYREFTLSSWEAEKFKKLLNLDMPLSEVVRLSESEVIDMLMEGARKPELLAEDDYSKLLIFISGNLDEAYRMADDVEDSDSDADAVRAFTENIDINIIKSCLMKRFRAEQIARFGNDHVIYKSLSRESYVEIIRRKINEGAKNCSNSTGVKVRIRKSVNKMVYDNGVYPTQGTRPVFSTISEVISKSVPDAIMLAMEKEIEKISIGYNFKKRAFVCEVGDDVLEIPYTGSIDLIKDDVESCADRKSLIAVHEAGHALTYAALFGVVPVQVSPVSSFRGGFIMQHNKMSSKVMIYNQMVTCMAGRAAEQIVFGIDNASEGARSDMESATSTASSYIRKHGFSNGAMGFHMPDNTFDYIQGSDETDIMISQMLRHALDTATKVIEANMDAFMGLISEFRGKRKIKQERIMEILNDNGMDAVIVDVKKIIISKYSSCLDNFLQGRRAVTCLVPGGTMNLQLPEIDIAAIDKLKGENK